MSGVVVVAMLFNAGMIPVFLIVTKLNMYNTIWSTVYQINGQFIGLILYYNVAKNDLHRNKLSVTQIQHGKEDILRLI